MADPVFTEQQIKDDGKNRVGKTAGQAGGATALVVVAQAGLQAKGWLHGELEPVVFGAYVTLATIGAASLMNLGKLRGKN